MRDCSVEENVVYGMRSGLALLLDAHRPARPNGLGVVYIPGSAWHAPQAVGSPQLKDLHTGVAFVDEFNRSFVDPLLDAGYTVFVINHRAAPTWRHPAAVEDAQRAVRFVRHHAQRFGVDASRLAAVGYSSGAHLASMLGVLDGAGDPAAADLVERESASVQAVVAGALPSDLTDLSSPLLTPVVASYLGALLFFVPPDSAEARLARDASPITHVSAGDAPHLLFHGEEDEVIPFAQSERFAAALRKAGVRADLLRISRGTHMNTRPEGGPDYIEAMLRFLRETLGDS